MHNIHLSLACSISMSNTHTLSYSYCFKTNRGEMEDEGSQLTPLQAAVCYHQFVIQKEAYGHMCNCTYVSFIQTFAFSLRAAVPTCLWLEQINAAVAGVSPGSRT